MITTRTVCIVCFVLHLGTANNGNPTEPQTTDKTDTQPSTAISNTDTSSNVPRSTTQENTSIKGNSCTTPSPVTTKGHCIFFLPSENKLILVLVVLMVACFTLLLITLICSCQVCHLKTKISRFQPHHHSVDLHAVKKSESLGKYDGREGQPTETCFMLSEVTEQEEGNRKESVQISSEPPVGSLNGDVTLEGEDSCEVESKEPDVGAPEISDTGV